MKKIKFGVLGCASVAKRLVIPALKKNSAIELVAVASRTAEKSAEFATEFDCKGMTGYDSLLGLAEIDAIYMPLPTGLHFDWAHRALDAGKHLFIEKSLGCDLQEVRSIIDKARKRNLLIKENYMFEYHAQQTVVREIIKTRLGEVRLFRASFGFPPLPPDNFRYSTQLGGGALLDAGGYVLKASSVFFPELKPKVLTSTLTRGECGVDIAGAAMIELRDAQRCIPAHVAFGFDHFYQCGIEVWGSKGKVITDRTFTAGPASPPSLRIETADGIENLRLPVDDHFCKIIDKFVNVIDVGDYSFEYEAILKQAELQDQLRRVSNAGQNI